MAGIAGPAAQIQTAPAGSGGLNTFVNVLQLLKGSSQTTQNNVSAGGVNEIVASILRGNQGLATVASGEKAAGLYNSTVNTQMLNDLTTSAAAKAELARSGTTTKAPGLLDAKTLLQLGGVMGAQKLLGPAAKKMFAPFDNVGQKISDSLFGGSGGLSPTGSSLGGSSELAGMSNAAAVGGTADSLAGSGTLGLGETAGFGSFLGSSIGAAPEVGTGLSGSIGSFAAETGVADAVGSYGGFELAGTAAAAAGAAEVAGTAATVAGAGEIIGTTAAVAEGGGFLAGLAEIGTFLASLFSDERLKTDINPVGKTNEGQQIYTYKYIDNPITTHMGVMAQESPREAVVVDPITKYLRVNYSKIK